MSVVLRLLHYVCSVTSVVLRLLCYVCCVMSVVLCLLCYVCCVTLRRVLVGGAHLLWR